MKEREREKIDVLAINNLKVDRDKCMEVRVTFWLWFEENVKPKKITALKKKNTKTLDCTTRTMKEQRDRYILFKI